MWFCIQTDPNGEKKASSELRRHGIRVYLPKRSFEVRNRGKGTVTVKRRPLFTGYLFVRFPDQLVEHGVPKFRIAGDCQGVRSFLCYANGTGERVPFPIPNSAVAQHMRRQRRREFDDAAQQEARRRKLYAHGREMMVSAGPFAEFLATVQTLRDNGSVVAEIDVLGRPVRIMFDKPDDFLKPIAFEREAA